MTSLNELRLLPWSDAEGRPCYLSTDDPNGYLSRLADHTEAIQLGMAGELLEHASELLGEAKLPTGDLRAMTKDLAEALRTTLRVAASRGQRLSQPDPEDPAGADEGPRPQRSAFS